MLLAGHIGAPPGAGGRLLVAVAIGSLIGSLASSRWLTPRHAEPVMIAGLVAFGASLAALAVTPSMPCATAAFVAAGIAEGPVFAAALMLRQRESPRPARAGQHHGRHPQDRRVRGRRRADRRVRRRHRPGRPVLAIAGFQLAGAPLGYLLLRTPARETRATVVADGS